MYFKIHHSVVGFMLFFLVKTYDTQFYYGILVRSRVHNKHVFKDTPFYYMFYVILVKTYDTHFSHWLARTMLVSESPLVSVSTNLKVLL